MQLYNCNTINRFNQPDDDDDTGKQARDDHCVWQFLQQHLLAKTKAPPATEEEEDE